MTSLFVGIDIQDLVEHDEKEVRTGVVVEGKKAYDSDGEALETKINVNGFWIGEKFFSDPEEYVIVDEDENPFADKVSFETAATLNQYFESKDLFYYYTFEGEQHLVGKELILLEASISALKDIERNVKEKLSKVEIIPSDFEIIVKVFVIDD